MLFTSDQDWLVRIIILLLKLLVISRTFVVLFPLLVLSGMSKIFLLLQQYILIGTIIGLCTAHYILHTGTCSIIIEFVLAWDMNRTRKTMSGHISQYGLWTCKDKTALKLWFLLLLFSNNYHFYLLSAAAHLNLGIVLSDMGHFEKALKVWNIFITDSVGMLYLNLSIAKNSVRKMIKWSKPILQKVEVILQMNFTYKYSISNFWPTVVH